MENRGIGHVRGAIMCAHPRQMGAACGGFNPRWPGHGRWIYRPKGWLKAGRCPLDSCSLPTARRPHTSRDVPPRRSRLQRSEQKRTSSQHCSHFLRQENARPHPAHGLDGRSALAVRDRAGLSWLFLPIIRLAQRSIVDPAKLPGAFTRMRVMSPRHAPFLRSPLRTGSPLGEGDVGG